MDTGIDVARRGPGPGMSSTKLAVPCEDRSVGESGWRNICLHLLVDFDRSGFHPRLPGQPEADPLLPTIAMLQNHRATYLIEIDAGGAQSGSSTRSFS